TVRLAAERGVRLADRTYSNTQDAVIVQFLPYKTAESCQNIARIGDQLFEPYFGVVVTQPLSIPSSFSDDPVPVNSRDDNVGGAVPPGPFYIVQLGIRERNIPAIANDVDDQRVGNCFLNPLDMQ